MLGFLCSTFFSLKESGKEVTLPLNELKDAIYKCIRCGSCRAACPTFGEELSETAVARGRVALVEAVLEGRLSLTPAFEKVIFHCAMCGACKAGCPSGVDVPAIVEAAREELVKKKGSEPLARFLAKKSLKDKRSMDMAFALMSLGRSAYGPLAATPLGKYLPYQYRDFKRSFPKIPSKPLAARVPELSKADNPKGRVAFYAGCVVNYVYPEIGEAAIRVLNRAGFDVSISKDELCCGKPLLSLGETDAARPIAEKTAAALAGSDADFVVTACPTCALTLRYEYPKILDGLDGAVRLSGMVRDITSFLAKETDIIGQTTATGQKVTYHDPCHLNFGMGIKAEPRALIKAAAGNLAEMAESERCCGFGGSFSFLNYELSGRIAARKAGNIEATGAEAVVTACPGCMMHIADALSQKGLNLETLHVVQLLDRAIKPSFSFGEKEKDQKKTK